MDNEYLKSIHVFFIGAKLCRVPKLTFTSVADIPENSRYIQKYITVAWCLYPHVPEKSKKLYVQISNKHSNHRRYFEITNHTACRCHGFNKSTAGYEELRKANVRELINKPNNGKSTSPRK